ncbi:MAG TPA: hypothetical protein PKA81_00845 [Clostridia bacterium]|nr:hypothetical protein [Clostridia bacterium]
MDPSKLYVEYYAKLHTDRAMKLWPFFLKKSERPDFISKHGELGIEVTRAAIEEWAQQEADMNRHFGDEMPGEAVEQSILSDCDCDDAIANGAEDGEGEGLFELPRDVKEMHIGRIIERIEDKTKALKEYRLCRENWLYIFSETTGLERTDLLRVQAFFDEQEGTPLFDKVLVKVGCQLYVLVRGEELSEITLRSRALLAMHRRARWLSLRDSKKKA